MTKSRWGGARPPATKGGLRGRIGRGAARARDWADDKTGRRASTGWAAARNPKNATFRDRRRAATAALRGKGAGRVAATGVGLIAAAFASLASLFSSLFKRRADGDEAEDAAATTAADGYTLGEPVPGNPGANYADPGDTRPGFVDRAGLPPDHPGYTTGHYDANVDPRTWEQRVAADHVRTSNSATTGGTMTGLPAAIDAHQMATNMARYAPADAWAVVAESRQWNDVATQVATAVKCYADRLEAERFPLNQAINEKLYELAQAILATRSIADEIPALLHRAHQDDIARRESTRGDETKWNV
ncbi:hypothetical protein [Marinactinospora rubrisoli]|uniref:Uncharacterized protein n=1 Tax=Marinactinospora rubrisoli TaxID=2715399 RepID=A0ABW2KNJ7_9ACTN